MARDVCDEIWLERQRQIEAEGWSVEHDDQWSNGALARAGACYALHAGSPVSAQVSSGYAPQDWPWEVQWWKPKDRRRDLVRAAALIVAEIERIDRAAGAQEKAIVRTYKLRRYGRRGLMAEGAEVRASSEDEAIAKARALFSEPEYEHDRFEIEAVE